MASLFESYAVTMKINSSFNDYDVTRTKNHQWTLDHHIKKIYKEILARWQLLHDIHPRYMFIERDSIGKMHVHGKVFIPLNCYRKHLCCFDGVHIKLEKITDEKGWYLYASDNQHNQLLDEELYQPIGIHNPYIRYPRKKLFEKQYIPVLDIEPQIRSWKTKYVRRIPERRFWVPDDEPIDPPWALQLYSQILPWGTTGTPEDH